MENDIDIRVLMPPKKLPSVSEVQMRWAIAERLERQIVENLVELKVLDKKRAESVIGKEQYQEYIKSKLWIATRERILKRDHYNCVLCGASTNLRVHHITYENLGAEKDEDLVTLCNSCHGLVHANELSNPFFLLKKAYEILESWKKENSDFKKEVSSTLLPILEETKVACAGIKENKE